MKPCFIFDLDGTLANANHRLYLITGENANAKKWDEFFDLCHLDTPIEHMIALAWALNSAGWPIVIVSGRSDVVRGKTEEWLRQHFPFYEKLLMRPAEDHKDDDILKMEMLAELRAMGYEPEMAFDDRSRVVSAWRAAGIPCAQVAAGDF